MPEEAKRPVCEVDDSSDNYQSNYPVSQLVEHRKARTDEQLNEVVPGPLDHGIYREPGGTGEAIRRSSDEVSHVGIVLCYD